MMFDSKEVVTVVTSLDKRDIEKQRQSIETWQNFGLSVVSVNAEADVRVLGGQFPGVAFVIDKNAKRNPAGVFYAQFDSLLGVLRQSKGRISGIVSADVSFTENIASLLRKETEGAVVYGTQITKKQLKEPGNDITQSRFDFIFYNKLNKLDYPPSQFLVGLNWWDSWAILFPIIFQIPVKRIGQPERYYQRQNYNGSDKVGFENLGRLFAQLVKPKVVLPGKSADEYYRNVLTYIYDNSLEI